MRAGHRFGCAIALAVALMPAPVRAETAAPPAAGASGLERRLGALLPLDARFRASDGRELALGDALARGKPTLLVLAYNRCTMLCNLVLRRAARLVTELGLSPGADYGLLSISIDPTDSVDIAARQKAALLDAAGLAGRSGAWTSLVGERAAIDAVAGAIGFRYVWDPATEQYAHPAVLTSIGADGRVSAYFDGLDPDVGAVRAALGGKPRPAAAITQALARCFRFDTASTRYGSALMWSLRALATGLSLGLVVLVVRLGRRRAAGGAP
jgi:protein SCO1/2